MWYPASTTAPPTAEPITLPEASIQCGILPGETDFNEQLGRLIKTARDHVEKYCGLRFAKQTIAAKCDCFGDMARLEDVPVNAAPEAVISYVDPSGAVQTLPDTVYEVRADGFEASIVLKPNQSWPATQQGSRITLTIVVGYDAAPESVRHAMLMLICHWFHVREAVNVGNIVSEVPMAVDVLLCNYRRGV